MEIKVLTNGIFASNTYIVESARECAIIDCGNKPEDVVRYIEKKELTPKYIILTHGHGDHIFYAGQIREATGGLLCLHEEELTLYTDADKNGYNAFGFSRNVENPVPDKLLKDGDKLVLGDETLEIIHTPGHSPGGICILIGDSLFSGDTLFQSSVGRTDLYGGNHRELVESIKNRLYTLDEAIKVYPGHGMDTTIGYERENNPYV